MQLYSNNASSKLNTGISNVSLSVTVKPGDGAKFPNPTGGDFFLVTLSKVTGGIESQIEIVKVTARSSDVLTIIRAQEGTSAGVYAEDDFLQLRMTAATATAVESHMNNTSNPHSVTKAQVGLGSVDNTADADKPVSTAQSTAIGLKYDKTGGTVTGNVTINTGADSRVLLQSTGTTQGQFQATAANVRLASNNALPLIVATNGVDRITLDSVGNGTFGASGATGLWKFQGNNTGDLVMLESTDASATAAPDFVLYRNSASPAANDQLGVIIWRGKDSGAADQQYARIGVEILDPTAASEDADLWFETTVAGAAVERMRLSAAGASFVGTITGTGGIQNTAVGNVTPNTGAFTTLSATGAIKSTGANLVNEASAIKISQEGVSASSITAYGVNSGTQGALSIVTKSSDGTASTIPAVFSSTGVAVTGAVSTTGYGLIGTTVSAGAGVSRGQVGRTADTTAGFLVQSATAHAALFASSTADTYLIVNTGNAFRIGHGPADGSSFSEKVQIDASGNLALGVVPSASGVGRKSIDVSTVTTLTGNVGGNTDTSLTHNAYHNGTNWIYRNSSTSAALYQMTGANAGSTHTWSVSAGGTAGNAITFVQAMTLTAAGELYVGTTSSGTLLPKVRIIAPGNQYALETQSNTVSYYAQMVTNTATSGDNLLIYFGTDADGLTQRGSIDYNRGGGLVRYNTTSDYRAKDVYGPVLDSGAQLDALKVYRGKMHGATIERPMLIAHEAQEIAPYAVSGTKDAVKDDGTPLFQTVDHSCLVPLLIAELQSLRARVAQLEGI